MSRKSLKYDTVQGGIEISAATMASSGTLGCVVYGADRTPMILTNHHVAYEDEEEAKAQIKLIKQRVEIGGRKPPGSDEAMKMLGEGHFPIFQPAFLGGENRSSRIVAFVTRVSARSDAALCALAPGIEHDRQVLASPSFSITGITEPRLDMLVMKSGKSTDVTFGVVTGINGDDIVIEHPFHKVLPVSKKGQQLGQDPNVQFTGQERLFQGTISDAGDSGAVWVEADTKKAVGLLYKGLSPFAHGLNYSVAKAMGVIAEKLKFTFE